MALNDYDYRPITFQGETLPGTLMAISVLEQVLDIADEDLADWLRRLPIGCGVTKTAPAEKASRYPQPSISPLGAPPSPPGPLLVVDKTRVLGKPTPGRLTFPPKNAKTLTKTDKT